MRGTPSEDQVYDLNPSEGRERLTEAMDLVLKALTEPEPFAWEGRYYQYRTVSVWPWPVQRPLPPLLVATRSADTVQFAASRRLGLGISYERPDDMAGIVEDYQRWSSEAGWQPDADDIVYRGGICLAETNEKAHALRDRVHAAGGGRGMNIGRSLALAVQAARSGRSSPPPDAPAPAQPDGGARRTQLNFVGNPDTVVEQLRAYRERCGVGVVDLAFQQPGLNHQDVMAEIELFGREVLPRIHEF
jgi:alkanesulfonate monooxygenase SsuD/methylene tetrahydromethanopterin reductase-like flavin-dependent oxidoreductase (luciferase family)